MKSKQTSNVTTSRFLLCLILVAVGSIPVAVLGEERTEHFDHDPNWDGYNNRSPTPEPQLVSQQFAYSKTQHAGGAAAGEIGGSLTPAGEPTYYAKQVGPLTFDDTLTASGKSIARVGTFTFWSASSTRRP